MIVDVGVLDDLRELVRKDPRTRRAIAEAAHIAETNLSTFMKNRRQFDLDTAERLAIALGYPLKPTQPATRPRPRKPAK